MVGYLDEFNLVEIEYQDGGKKVKVSKATNKSAVAAAVVSPNKAVLSDPADNNEIRIKSPIIGTAYLAPETGAKKFVEVGDKIKKGQTGDSRGNENNESCSVFCRWKSEKY